MFNVRSFSLVESKFFINVSKENRKFIYGFMYLYSIQQSPPFRLVSNINIASKACNNFQLLSRVIFIETIEKNLNIPKQNLSFHEFERILDR